MIGKIGTKVGEFGINIGQMGVGREVKDQKAVMGLTLDEPISARAARASSSRAAGSRTASGSSSRASTSSDA